MALTAAETATSCSARSIPRTVPDIDRMIDVFPTNQQEQIRSCWPPPLRMVTQQLIVNADGTGRVPVQRCWW